MPDDSKYVGQYHKTVTFHYPPRSRRKRGKQAETDEAPDRVEGPWIGPDGKEVPDDDPGLREAMAATLAPVYHHIFDRSGLPRWLIGELTVEELRGLIGMYLSNDPDERRHYFAILEQGLNRVMAELQARRPADDAKADPETPLAD